MKVETIFGIDTNGNDIFVIKKANMFKVITEEPTDEEWNDLSIDFNFSLEELIKIKDSFYEWKNWYRRLK